MAIWQSGGINQQGFGYDPAFVHVWTATSDQTLVVTADQHYDFDFMDAKGPELGLAWDLATGRMTLDADGGGHYFMSLTAAVQAANNNAVVDIHGLFNDVDAISMGIAANQLRTANTPYTLATVGCFTGVEDDTVHFEIKSDTSTTLTIVYASVLIYRVAETAQLP